MSANSIVNVIIPPIIGIVGVIIGSYLTYIFGFKAQLKLQNSQLRKQLFGELMGLKFIVSQIFVSRFEALINSDYHERKWQLVGYPKDSIDFQEANRWMHKSEDLTNEISRNNYNLFKTIGIILSVYPNTRKLKELSNQLYKFKTPLIKIKADEISMAGLEKWKTDAVKEVQTIIDQQFNIPIESLLEYMSSENNRLG